MMPPLAAFHATIAAVTNEQHQNMAGLVQDGDFNADIVVRFLRENGIDARVDESGLSVDERVMPALARALGVPLCRLVCGEHD